MVSNWFAVGFPLVSIRFQMVSMRIGFEFVSKRFRRGFELFTVFNSFPAGSELVTRLFPVCLDLVFNLSPIGFALVTTWFPACFKLVSNWCRLVSKLFQSGFQLATNWVVVISTNYIENQPWWL